ncbi:MAG: energy-coupling factor ABC transporter permease [Candidatus Methanosuratincola sp.]
MHIPDGFLSLPIIAVTYVLTISVLAISFRKVKGNVDERLIPLMALLTALFFAVQMVNYPIIGGTTAHLLGAPALGIILGPWLGSISMTIILVLQCFLFADGGVTALGANILNMAIIGVMVPYGVYSLFSKKAGRGAIGVGIFIGSFLGDVLGAVAAGLELGLSAPIFQYGVSIAVPAMGIHHSVIGLAEGFVTLVVVYSTVKIRPSIMALNRGLSVLLPSPGGVKNE